LIIPSTTDLTINGSGVQVEAMRVDGDLSRTVSLRTTVSDRRQTKTFPLLIGDRGQISPFWFALGTLGSSALVADIICDSDVYVNGGLQGAGSLSTSEKAYVSVSSLILKPTASGGIVYNKAIPIPIIDPVSYKNAADTIINNLPGATLNFKSLGAYQSLWYKAAGTLAFKHTYQGAGTIFVNGNVRIDGLSAVSSTDKLVIIATGSVQINTNSVDAFIFCKGLIDFTSKGTVRVNGALHCSSVVSNVLNINLTFDPFFWSSPQWDQRMHVPGMW
jgi:hypothetical protein